jgi:hypothetical protein
MNQSFMRTGEYEIRRENALKEVRSDLNCPHAGGALKDVGMTGKVSGGGS